MYSPGRPICVVPWVLGKESRGNPGRGAAPLSLLASGLKPLSKKLDFWIGCGENPSGLTMPESVLDIVKYLIRFDRASIKATEDFRNWKHNDRILPPLEEQLETILQAYEKFEPIVYDTQGIHDDGVDLVLKHREKEESVDDVRLIGFQVKSFSDLSRKGYLQELKAQHGDAFRKVSGLEYLFIMLCTDATEHQNKIRQICAEFRSDSKTEIIVPGYSFAFLSNTRSRVYARVKRKFDEKDVVYRKAVEILDMPDPSARALTIFLASKNATEGKSSFGVNFLKADAALRDVYRGVGKRVPYQLDFDDQIAQDLEGLDSKIIDLSSERERVDLRTEAVLPITALIMDALVRYEHGTEGVVEYMLDLLGALD